MSGAFLGVLSTLTSTLVWQDPSNYYCAEKTFNKTPVSISRDQKFVTDVSADPNQNLTLLMEAGSFTIDVTGCLTPMGIIMPATGIEITYQNLPTLYGGAVQNIILLQMIKIENSNVREIQPGAFMTLPSIESIFLRYNEIGRIEEGVFNHLRVERLFLSNNSIVYIESGAFDDMPNLATIELDSNKLKNWHNDWFSNSPNVQHLSLDCNKLEKLPAHAFDKLKNDRSTSIRLSNNQIGFIHPTAFRKLDLLYALWLDHNGLTDLDVEAFVNFKQLYILSLAGNKLECLSNDFLYNLHSQELLLRIEKNSMNCLCLRNIQNWAKTRNYFLTERYAKEECDKSKTKNTMFCS